eukprot:COSAG01_NODE_39440_length_476_cov_1.241379_1_plen_30_part_10
MVLNNTWGRVCASMARKMTLVLARAALRAF